MTSIGRAPPARPERAHAGRHLRAARHRAHAHLRHHEGGQLHARGALRVRRVHDVRGGNAPRRELLRRAAARHRARRRARRGSGGRAPAAPARRRHRHADAGDDRRLDRAAERRAVRVERRRQIDRLAVSRRAARHRPGVSSVESRLRLFCCDRAHRGDVCANQPHQARPRDARHLPGPRDCGADGRADRHHPHHHVRARLGACRGGGRAPRAGVRRLSEHGRPRRRQGVRHRDPRRLGQRPGRHRRRLHPRARGRARRGLPRRDGVSPHHRHPPFPADRPLRAQGEDRVKAALTLLLLAVLATLPFWLDNAYLLHVVIITGIFIIAAMSLNLLLGFAGQLSLGHVAFFGIGAYASSLVALGFKLTTPFEVTVAPNPVWLAMLADMLAAGLAGWFIGRIAFKVRGAYFVIVSISFAEVMRLVAVNWLELTQGPMALNNIPPLELFGHAFWKKPENYWLVLAVAVFSYILIRRLVHSRAGRAMIALAENEALATSVGIDVPRDLVLAAVVSAAIAGAAGALYAHYVRIVDPDVFLFVYTVTMVIMVVTGGKGTLAGPVVGGLIFGLLPEGLRAMAIAPEMQWIAYGILMVLVVYFLPVGIVPALRRR